MAKKYIDAEKLKEKIDEVRQDWLGDSTGLEVVERGAELGATESILDSIDDIIESLQQEQPEVDLEEAAENIYKIPFGTRAEDFIAGAEWGAEHLAGVRKMIEPETDLEEAAEEYSRGLDYYHYTEDDPAIAFKAGAKWMQDQFEKNRLANCDKLTKEEYDRETDFATEIIEKEHRQPTFTDAINYGMRVMKEWMMSGAVEGFFTKSIDGNVVFAESTALDVDPKSVKVGDKVKLIVIKED